MKDDKQPWGKFYFSDWRSDPKLRVCTLAARGLWMEMLAIMHEAEPKGFLTVNGRGLTPRQLAGLCGCALDELEAAYAELETADVFSRDEETEIVFSRRMRRDVIKCQRDRENGKLGGNPKVMPGVNPKPNRKDKPPENGEDKAQKLEARGQNISNLKVARPKRVRTKIDYSEKFLLLWARYPTDALMSKKLAFEAFGKMADEDQESAIVSTTAFRAYCTATPDYRPVHLVRYLTQRRFEGFASLGEKISSSIFVAEGTPAWGAWQSHLKAEKGKGSPAIDREGRRGWFFASEWPPKKEAA